jgi:hypothetical protein
MHGALESTALDTDYLILLSLVWHWKFIMTLNSTKIIEKTIEKYVLLTFTCRVPTSMAQLVAFPT